MSVPSSSSGTQRVVVCVENTTIGDIEVTDDVSADRGSIPGGGWAGVGNTAMECNPPADDARYWCYWAGAGATITFTTAGDLGTGGTASACEGRHNWELPHCVVAVGAVGVDGPAGRSMGVGAWVIVCDSQVGTTCVPDALGLPSGAWIDLTPYRDEAGSSHNVHCGSNLC